MEKEKPKVKIYSTPTCIYCVTLKKFLEKNSVAFVEIDVSLNNEVAQEMIDKSGQMGVPVVEIGEEIIIGFDKEKITRLLGL